MSTYSVINRAKRRPINTRTYLIYDNAKGESVYEHVVSGSFTSTQIKPVIAAIDVDSVSWNVGAGDVELVIPFDSATSTDDLEEVNAAYLEIKRPGHYLASIKIVFTITDTSTTAAWDYIDLEYQYNGVAIDRFKLSELTGSGTKTITLHHHGFHFDVLQDAEQKNFTAHLIVHETAGSAADTLASVSGNLYLRKVHHITHTS